MATKSHSSDQKFLHQSGTYLDQTFLESTDNAKAGGIIMSHCQFTRRDAATRDLSIRLNENEDHPVTVQLTPYTVWNKRDGPQISTRLLAVECAKEDVFEVKRRMFAKLFNVPGYMEFSNTRFFKFIPFNPTGSITNRIIRSGIYLQNKFLTQCTAITVVNINSPN